MLQNPKNMVLFAKNAGAWATFSGKNGQIPQSDTGLTIEIIIFDKLEYINTGSSI